MTATPVLVSRDPAPHKGDRVMPHDLDAEQAVLGACLLNPQAFITTSGLFHSEPRSPFFRHAHQLIFAAMGAIARRGEPIDCLTVRNELAKSGSLDEAGGPAYISSLTDGIPFSANVGSYAKIVMDDAALRRTIGAASEIVTAAYKRDAEQVAASVAHLTAPRTALSPVSATPLLDDAELMNLPDPQFLIAGLLQERSVCVVYGPPGLGKTTLIAEMATVLAIKSEFFGCPVARHCSSLYVAAEDPTGFKMRLAATKRAHRLALDCAIGVFTYPSLVDLRDYRSVAGLRDYVLANRHRFDHDLGVLFIDTYAAATPGATENSSEDTTTAMAHARILTKDLDCAVVLVHHTNASGQRERGHSSMRGDADTMVSLVPVDDEIQVHISKQRNGPSDITLVTLRMVPEVSGSGMVFRLAGDVLPTGRPSPKQMRALVTLRDTFGTVGATATEWQRACHDIDERTFYRVRKSLLDSGHVANRDNRYFTTSKGATA